MNIRRENDVAIVCDGNPLLTLSQWGPLMDELDRLDCAAVIDARSLFGNLTEIEAYLLALRTDEMRQLRRHRLAVVMSGDPLPDLDFFINSVRNCGLQIESFDCIDTAITWAGVRPRRRDIGNPT